MAIASSTLSPLEHDGAQGAAVEVVIRRGFQSPPEQCLRFLLSALLTQHDSLAPERVGLLRIQRERARGEFLRGASPLFAHIP
jgi:hypothetical protein